MSKETKLLLESWRKFLAEGNPADPGFDRDPEDPPLEGEPLEIDPDLIDEPLEEYLWLVF